MKYGIGLCASAVPTARTASGLPISRATHPYGRTSPRRISSVLCSTACANGVNPRRSNFRRRLPFSWSAILAVRSAGGSTRTSRRPTARRNHSSNFAADSQRIAAETPTSLHATYTGPSTVSNTAYESALARPSTRSAKPAGALSSPSRLSSFITVAMVLSSQDLQSTMHVRLDGSDRLPEHIRHLRIRQVLHMPQHDRLAVAGRQACHPRGQPVDLGPPDRVVLRAG